jgi:hypothetical protein
MEEEQRPGLKPIRMDPSDVDPLANGGRREVITMDSTSERDGLIIAGVHYMPDEVAQAQKMLDFLPAGTDIAAILQGLRATATHTRAPSTATEPRAPAYQETAALKKELNHLVTAMVKARAYLPGYDQREANREVNEKIGVYTRKNASAEQLKLGIEYCTATLRQLREELRTS